MSDHSGSTSAILFALGANLGIALAKSAAAFFTGSGAMLAESLHSFADCGNQLLLLFGMKQSKKAPTEDHPMGYGRDSYFWSMMVGLLLFSVGGLFSVYHGIHSLHNPEPVQYLVASIAVLAVAVCLEGAALRSALHATKEERAGGKSIWHWFRNTRKTELLVIISEDTAALAGLAIALVALTLTAITGNPVFDAIGTICVGILLIVVAIAVVFEVKSAMTGESAPAKLRAEIRTFVEAQPEVDRIINMLTQQFGDYLMVALKVKMQPMASAEALTDAIDVVEERLQAQFPQIRYSFFEPDSGLSKDMKAKMRSARSIGFQMVVGGCDEATFAQDATKPSDGVGKA